MVFDPAAGNGGREVGDCPEDPISMHQLRHHRSRRRAAEHMSVIGSGPAQQEMLIELGKFPVSSATRRTVLAENYFEGIPLGRWGGQGLSNLIIRLSLRKALKSSKGILASQMTIGDQCSGAPERFELPAFLIRSQRYHSLCEQSATVKLSLRAQRRRQYFVWK
jgi:hypothetical protein